MALDWQPLSDMTRQARIKAIESEFNLGQKSLKQIIHDSAVEWTVDPLWVFVVCEIESGWLIWEPRFEPAYVAQVRQAHPGLTDTQYSLRSHSWGLGHILGETAVTILKYKKSLPSLANPMNGVPLACEYLWKCKKNRGEWLNAISAYNGGEFDTSTGKYTNAWHVEKARRAYDNFKTKSKAWQL